MSLTMTPMMCSRLLKHAGEEMTIPGLAAISRGIDRMVAFYHRTLLVVLRHQRATLLLTLATIAATVAMYIVAPKGFLPLQDTASITAVTEAGPDVSFAEMQSRQTEAADAIKNDPDVTGVVSVIGAGSVNPTTNVGRLVMTLKPRGERRDDIALVVARLKQRVASIPGMTVYFQPVQDVRVGGRASNAQYQYTLQGDNVQDLLVWGPRMLQKLRTVPGLLDLNSDQQTKGLEAGLVIDRATASRLGITAQMIDNTLYDAFGQRQVSTMYTQLNQYHVVLEVDPQFWQNPESLKHIYIKTPAGAQVPLSAFTHYEPATAPLVVNHQGQFPAVTLSFNLRPGLALGDAVEAVEQAGREIGLPGNIHGSFQGTARAFQSSLASEPLLIAAALATVYIVLGMLYESTIHPVTILSTLPSAGLGALLALVLCGTDLSVIALIGIILLIGIVKKNAILMIDFALEAERNEGKKPVDAIYQACLLRFRPIMMTTMAALLGGLPLALGTGVGSELRRPLGIAIVGGLIVSQMLTLYTTPVIYLYLDRRRLWFEGLRARRARPIAEHVG